MNTIGVAVGFSSDSKPIPIAIATATPMLKRNLGDQDFTIYDFLGGVKGGFGK